MGKIPGVHSILTSRGTPRFAGTRTGSGAARLPRPLAEFLMTFRLSKGALALACLTRKQLVAHAPSSR
jgi:hypothetical protein